MNWGVRLGAGVVLSVLAGCGGSDAPITCSVAGGTGLAVSPWPKFRGDDRNTGRSAAVLVDSGAPMADSAATCGQAGSRCQWRFETGASVVSSPAIGPDGGVYVGSSDAKVYALTPDGDKKWEVVTGGPVTSSPAVDGGGLLFVGSGDGNLYGLATIDGTVARGPINLFGFIAASPALSNEVSTRGIVYVGTLFGSVVSLCPNVVFRWEVTSVGPVRATAAIAADGTIYLAGTTQSQVIIALDNETGEPRWTYTAGAPIYASPLVADDGTIYVAVSNGVVNRFDANGNPSVAFDVRTVADTPGSGVVSVTASPALAAGNEILYVAASIVRDSGLAAGLLIAVNLETGAHWIYTVPGAIDSSPAVTADGTVIFGAGDGVVYALRDLGSTPAVRWTFSTGAPVRSSPAVGDGVIYVGSDDRFVYALRP